MICFEFNYFFVETKLCNQEFSNEPIKKLNQTNCNSLDIDHSTMLTIFDFYNCLMKVINNGSNINFNGSMKLLTKIIEMPNITVKKIFDVKSKDSIQLNFVDVRTRNGQCNLF